MTLPRRDGIVPRVRGVWWLHPVTPILAISGVMAVAAWAMSSATYRRQWGVAKIIADDDLVRIGACIAVLAICAFITSIPSRHPVPWPTLSETLQRSLRAAFNIGLGLTTVAYLVWMLTAVRNGVGPSAFLEAARSRDFYENNLREQIGTVAGVTTLTQIGVGVVIIAEVLRAAGATDAHARFRRRAVIALLVVNLLRSFFLSERLALLEVAIPIVVIRTSALVVTRPANRSRVALAPVLAVPLLTLLFGIFEYQRSWTFYSERTDQSYPSFVVTRMTGYYATAFNNGQLPDRYLDNPSAFPFLTATFLEDFPLTEDWAQAQAPVAAAQRDSLLPLYANPEFNSPGSFGPAVFDFGFPGALISFALTGVGLGLLFKSFTHGRLLGLLLYPVAFIGLTDLPRQIYWTLGRTVPLLAFLGITLVVAGRRSARHLQLVRLRPTPST